MKTSAMNPVQAPPTNAAAVGQTAVGPHHSTTVTTPIGSLVLVADGGALVEIRLPGPGVPLPRTPRPRMPWPGVPLPDSPAWRAAAPVDGSDALDRSEGGDDLVLAVARRQLDEYFAGGRTAFDLPLRLDGTPFQRDVWRALLDVGYGQTASYTAIAEEVGRPGAQRAVGAAVGRNPLPIVVPCHRIVGADGRLTGFGGGLPRKRYLLELEQHG